MVGFLGNLCDPNDFRNYALEVKKGGVTEGPSMANMAKFLRDVIERILQTSVSLDPMRPNPISLVKSTRLGKKVWMGEYFEEDADGGNLAFAAV